MNESNISIKSIEVTDAKKMQQSRELFIAYFMDLYKDISAEILGINGDIKSYLNTIFDKTEQALIVNDPILGAYLAYVQNDIVGFSTFGPLEDPTIILVRTLPINLAYKAHELKIRNAFIQYAKKIFSPAHCIIIMVRKANTAHTELCLQGGFKECPEVFEQYNYIRNSYDSRWYQGFLLKR